MATSPGAAGIGRNDANVGRPKPTSGSITVLGLLTELLGEKNKEMLPGKVPSLEGELGMDQQFIDIFVINYDAL